MLSIGIWVCNVSKRLPTRAFARRDEFSILAASVYGLAKDLGTAEPDVEVFYQHYQSATYFECSKFQWSFSAKTKNWPTSEVRIRPNWISSQQKRSDSQQVLKFTNWKASRSQEMPCVAASWLISFLKPSCVGITCQFQQPASKAVAANNLIVLVIRNNQVDNQTASSLPRSAPHCGIPLSRNLFNGTATWSDMLWLHVEISSNQGKVVSPCLRLQLTLDCNAEITT